ncbi:hypothetical protein IG631_23895 [Alternaria alternata]|jgi:hypothetical protein|nr:hypothetical protein IG631_23895 [Alternaria alternata]
MHQGCRRLDLKQRLTSQYLRVQIVVEATSDAQRRENKKDRMPTIRLKGVGAAHQAERGCASQPQPRWCGAAVSSCQGQV